MIPESRYNNFCKDVLELVKINKNQIQILLDNTVYYVKDYVKTNVYHAMPAQFTEAHLNIYSKIRNNLNIVQNTNPTKKIYLKRDGKPNVEYGNSETGIIRQIENENELMNSLRNIGFDIVTLGDKHIVEKSNVLNDSNIIITPLGANCVNLIFSNAPKNIIFLSNQNMFGDEYFISLFEKLNHAKINYLIFRYDGIHHDVTNQWNISFNVNIEEIIKCCV